MGSAAALGGLRAAIAANAELKIVVMLPEEPGFGSNFYHLTSVELQGDHEDRASYVQGHFGNPDDTSRLTERIGEILA